MLEGLPNIKSAEKRVRTTAKKTLRNQMIKSAMKTYIKKFEVAVESGNKDEAVNAYRLAVKKVDQAAAKGVINKNAASRRKSSMTVKLNAAA